MPSLRTSTGIIVVETETTASSNSVSRLKDELESVADHAWVDDEGEMDYSYVPFEEDQLFYASTPLESPFETVEDEEDPVVKALRQRQLDEDEEKRLIFEEEKRKIAEEEQRKPYDEHQKPRPAVPGPTVPSVSWRSTAAPVIAIKPVPQIAEVSIQPQSILRKPAGKSAPSPLEILINSIRNAAASHSSSPDNSHSLLFGTEEPVPAPPPVARMRTVVIRMDPNDRSIQSKFQPSTTISEFRYSPKLDLSRSFSMTAITVHKSIDKPSNK